MTVLNCIERIPSILTSIQDNRADNFLTLKKYISNEEISRVVFVGSGSSYNAAHASKAFFEHLGIHVDLYYPNIFLNYTNQFDSKALYVFISQGGGTKLVYQAIEMVKEKGYKNCSITSNVESPIAKISDVTIDMGCGEEEYLYRTIGFSSTVATCWQLAIVMAGKENSQYDDDYRLMIEHLPNIKDTTLKYFEKHKFSLLRKQQVFITGTNDLYPIANEADIKLMEMVPMVTRSFELEEFIHGPQNCFDSNIAYLVFARKDEDKEKATNIAKFLKNEIGYCAIVGDIALDDRDLFIDSKSQYFSNLEFVTVAQVLAYCWANDKGRDLSRPVNAVVKKYVNKTIE